MDTKAASTEEFSTKPPNRRHGLPHWLRETALFALFLILCLVSTGFFVTSFGAKTYHWRAFDLQVAIRPSMRGETRLDFMPVGEIRAYTHRTPVDLIISLRNISFDEMKKLIASPPPRPVLEKEFQDVARRSLRQFATHQLLMGALGALAVPLFFRPRKILYWLLPPIIGAGFVALVFFGTLHSFNKKGFDDPIYTGSLRQANGIIALVKNAFDNARTLSDRLRQVADNLNTLYTRINSGPGIVPEEDTVRILHISDIHNNPAAVDFVRKLADDFKVQAIIDTGDLTDLGSPIELNLSAGLFHGAVPYLFVAGNHDSQATVQAVRSHPNAVILNDEPVTVAGLSVLGSPDPSSARLGPGDVNTSPEQLKIAGDRLADAYRRAAMPPDIVCVHNPIQADPLIGQARLILCGHLHRAYVETNGKTVICNAGTTGAAGVRYFTQPAGVAFSAAIITFSRRPHPHLISIDQVILDGSLGQYSIIRRTFTEAP